MSETLKEKAKLFQKILEVKKSVSYLQKGRHKGAVQFSYVSSDQVLGAIREKMNEVGLLIVPAITGSNLTEFTTKNGSPQFMTEIDMQMIWVDTETGYEYPVPFYGQGVDNSEKGTGKALTYSEKYFILKSFNVPTAELDPDAFQDQHMNESDVKAKLISRLANVTTQAEVKNIWAENPKLKRDEEFVEAIKAAGARLAKVSESEVAEETKPKDD